MEPHRSKGQAFWVAMAPATRLSGFDPWPTKDSARDGFVRTNVIAPPSPSKAGWCQNLLSRGSHPRRRSAASCEFRLSDSYSTWSPGCSSLSSKPPTASSRPRRKHPRATRSRWCPSSRSPGESRGTIAKLARRCRWNHCRSWSRKRSKAWWPSRSWTSTAPSDSATPRQLGDCARWRGLCCPTFPARPDRACNSQTRSSYAPEGMHWGIWAMAIWPVVVRRRWVRPEDRCRCRSPS